MDNSQLIVLITTEKWINLYTHLILVGVLKHDQVNVENIFSEKFNLNINNDFEKICNFQCPFIKIYIKN